MTDFKELGKPFVRKGFLWSSVHFIAIAVALCGVGVTAGMAIYTGEAAWASYFRISGIVMVVLAGIAQLATHCLQNAIDPPGLGSKKLEDAQKKFGPYLRVQTPINLALAGVGTVVGAFSTGMLALVG